MTTHTPTPANAAIKLSQALSRKNLVIICGTGVTAAATGNSKESSWTGLIESGIDRVESLDLRDSLWADRARADVTTGLTRDMIVAAEKVTNELTLQPGAFETWLKESAGALRASDYGLLKSLGRLAAEGAVIVTTNYDSILSQHLTTDIVTSSDTTTRVQSALRGLDPAVVHLHGHWRTPSTVVFGSSTYSKVSNDDFMKLMMQTWMWSTTILFVGVGEGLADPNFQALRTWATDVIGETGFPHYRLARSAEKDVLEQDHQAENIAVIDYGPNHSGLSTFLDSIQVLTPVRTAISSGSAERRDAPAPAEMSPAVERRNSLLRARLNSLLSELTIMQNELSEGAKGPYGSLHALVLGEISGPMSISPGPMNTPMLERALADIGDDMDKFAGGFPQGGPANPQDVAKTVLYLASDDATYMNGANIVVDGGTSTGSGR